MRRRFIAMSAACGVALGLGACGGGDPESLTFDVAIGDRAIIGSQTEFEAKGGDSVTFNLTADEAAEFHVHGYDLRAESPAGGDATIAFTADATGSFPITVHLGEADAAAGEDAMGMGDAMETHGHEEAVEAPPGMGVALNVHPDSVSGFNVQIMPTAFTFAPERVNTAHVPGEGHAHLYIDGVKLRRVYGQWAHVDGLSSGMREISVTLNANTHERYAKDGQPITASATVHVEGGEPPTDTGDHGGDAAPTEITVGTLLVRPR